MTTLSEGQVAPQFTLQDQQGNTVSLADFKGKKQVLVGFFSNSSKTINGALRHGCIQKDYLYQTPHSNHNIKLIEPLLSLLNLG